MVEWIIGLLIALCSDNHHLYGDKIIKLFYFPLIIAGATLLSGCATLQLVSFGVSGISYAVSGKSISDHAISKVMAKDCALHRIVLGKSACVDSEYHLPGVLIADNSNTTPASDESHWHKVPEKVSRKSRAYVTRLPDNSKTAYQRKPQQTYQAASSNRKTLQYASTTSPDVIVKTLSSTTKIKGNKASDQFNAGYTKTLQRIDHNDDKPLLFAVVGSFNELGYAQKRIQAHRGLNAQLITNSAASRAKGATKYRVVVGPLTEQEFNHNIGRSSQSDLASAWRLRLCGSTMSPPPCDGAMLARN